MSKVLDAIEEVSNRVLNELENLENKRVKILDEIKILQVELPKLKSDYQKIAKVSGLKESSTTKDDVKKVKQTLKDAVRRYKSLQTELKNCERGIVLLHGTIDKGGAKEG